MKDTDCVTFLQWALPRLHLRWAGFRKVRRQVCRRVQQRIRTLGLSDICAYRNYLEQHAEEWSVLDGMTPITISSFYRDRDVWDFLWHEVLQNLATGEPGLRAWSIGCASGEEPFTLMLTWRFGVLPLRRDVAFSIVATDVHQQMLARAHSACYEPGSLSIASISTSGARTSAPRCPMKHSTSSCAETWFSPISMKRCNSKPWRGCSRVYVTVEYWLSGGVNPCRQTFPN
jgi:chemotaxis protein methyltransferase CheR